MDPISLIIAALVAGAAKAAGDAAPDAYNGLKALIKRKFESKGQSGANYVLDQHEKQPEAAKELLKGALIEAGADKDEKIIKASQELLKQLKPEESAAGKFNLNIAGDVKGIVGDISGGEIHQDIS